MKSPRFSARASALGPIFKPSNIQRIWEKKVRKFVRDQYLQDTIEYADFHALRRIESDNLSKLVLSGDYKSKSCSRVLVEKSKGLCRQIVVPSLEDAIILQCLSDAFYLQVKGKAPSNKAFFERKDHKLPGGGYGSFGAWLAFQKTLFSFTKTKKFVVVTDIANFYDSISYTHLRSVLSCISGVEETILDMLIFVLSSLLWQPDYSPRVEAGLPQMDLDAPRLMAHCLLYEVDAYMASIKDVEFTRFMDDIDMGVDDIATAKMMLKSIDLILQTRQIRLNSGKTIILTRAEAARHFRILDNVFLDNISARIKHKLDHGFNTSNEAKLVRKRINYGLKRKRFDHGNGEKILKRWLGLAGRIAVELSLDDVYNMFLLRPSQRETILRYMTRVGLTPSRVKIFNRLVASGQLVDEASFLDIAHTMKVAKYRTKQAKSEIISFVASTNTKQPYGLYIAMLLLARIREVGDLFELIKVSFSVWRADHFLGRNVAGYYPLIQESGHQTDFISLLEKSGNGSALHVLSFHQSLQTDSAAFAKIFPLLKIPNSSLPLNYTFSKYVLLLSALMNQSAPNADVLFLKNFSQFLREDAYLKSSPLLI